jgi:hypothetical protein
MKSKKYTFGNKRPNIPFDLKILQFKILVKFTPQYTEFEVNINQPMP